MSMWSPRGTEAQINLAAPTRMFWRFSRRLLTSFQMMTVILGLLEGEPEVEPEVEPEAEPEIEPMGPPMYTPRMYTCSSTIAKKTGDPNFGYGGTFALGSDSGYEEDNTLPSGVASRSGRSGKMQLRARHLTAKRSGCQSEVDSGYGEEASTSSMSSTRIGSGSGEGGGNSHHSRYSSNKRSIQKSTVDIVEPFSKRRRDGHSRSLPSA